MTNNTERPSKLHTCTAACGFCRATARLAAIEARNAKFEAIIDAEVAVRHTRATVECQLAGVPLFVIERNYKHWVEARANLSALIDSLTPSEARAFGSYRKAALKTD